MISLTIYRESRWITLNVKKLWGAAALSAASFIGGIGLTISSGWLITMASQQPPILTLTVAIVGVRFFGISRSVFRYAERIMSHSAVFTSLTVVRTKLFETIARTPITSMRTLVEGSLAKKVIDDVERAQEYQLRDVLPRKSALISVVAGSALAGWITPNSLLFTLPAFIIFFVLIPIGHRITVVPPAWRVEDKETELADLFSISQAELKEAEVFGYLDTIKADRQKKIEAIAIGERTLLAKISTLQMLTLITFGGALIAAIAVAQALHHPPSVRITMVIFVPLVIYEAVASWYPSMFTSAKLIRAQQSIDQISTRPLASTRHYAKPEGSQVVAHQVAVSWGSGFMNPVSFTASPQSPLLITGANGAGKSTLALGIAGLLPYQGSITISGVEVSSIENLEEFLSSSLQNSHIFNTSLRENLRIADQQAPDETLRSVLDLLELSYLDLDEVIGEFGRPLSGGEMKRVSIARALISPAAVVILDEPLEHLDNARATRIERSILNACHNRTLIVISHTGWKDLNNTLVLER